MKAYYLRENQRKVIWEKTKSKVCIIGWICKMNGMNIIRTEADDGNKTIARIILKVLKLFDGT